MILPNPWLLLGGLAAILAAAGAGYWKGLDHAQAQCAAREAERASIVQQVREANLQFADAVALQTANAIGKIRIQHQTINNEVRHEREVHVRVLENPDCAIPASTVGVLNAARGYGDAAQGAGGAAPAVPAAGAAPDR